MADGMADKSARVCRTICLPATEAHYAEILKDPAKFRQWLDENFQQTPELFPQLFRQGYTMKDKRTSKKLEIGIRRIELRDGTAWSVRPAFVTPGMVARTADVETGLFLRKFGVPFWALARVCGRDPMFWCRLEFALGRNSIVGTTVRRTSVPTHLLADEHHQTSQGRGKVFLATTVGRGCCLGVAAAPTAGADDLEEAYRVFQEEARDVEPDYTPETVNTDGWKSTQVAWKALFPTIVVLQCFLHAWLKIRQRALHLKDVFAEASQRVWHAYRAPNRRSFSQRLRRLRSWAETHLSGNVLEQVQRLCEKRDRWKIAYAHPDGHRTSNMLDRLMRRMNRYFFDGQHLHGSLEASDLHGRGWALLANFAPWNPQAVKRNGGWQSPAEHLNEHRYHDCWLQNLWISASCGGYRKPPPQKP